jgi:hypothetical protein
MICAGLNQQATRSRGVEDLKSGPSVLSNYNFDLDVRESRFLQLPYLLYR